VRQQALRGKRRLRGVLTVVDSVFRNGICVAVRIQGCFSQMKGGAERRSGGAALPVARSLVREIAGQTRNAIKLYHLFIAALSLVRKWKKIAKG
jgi:hypothetical protein